METVTVPQRGHEETELAHLRRKQIAFGIWQGDALERIRELEQQRDELTQSEAQLRATLQTIKAAMECIVTHTRDEIFTLTPEMFARDFAPFRNVMVAHGVEPYAKPKRTRKAVAST